MRPGTLLFFVFIVTPLIEIALFIVIGSRIGLVPTIALVFVSALLGASLVARQGRGTIDRVRRELTAGSFPGRQLAHGALILLAGALLVTPGFFTDAIGFALLVPPVRERVRRWAAGRFGRGRMIVL